MRGPAGGKYERWDPLTLDFRCPHCEHAWAVVDMAVLDGDIVVGSIGDCGSVKTYDFRFEGASRVTTGELIEHIRLVMEEFHRTRCPFRRKAEVVGR